MLVLTRKVGERIHIGDSIILTVVHLRGGIVRLGVEAPPKVNISREELLLTTAAIIGVGSRRMPRPRRSPRIVGPRNPVKHGRGPTSDAIPSLGA